MRSKYSLFLPAAIVYVTSFILASSLTFASEGMLKSAETVAVEVQYNLSTLDSRQSAIEAARAIARREAAEKAGTYIEGISSLENGELRESIKEVQTSVVSLSGEQTIYEITPDAPNGKLTLSAIAEVDTSTLQARTRALRENRELSKIPGFSLSFGTWRVTIPQKFSALT